ncbi:MAG: FHA domain-containing protein, partial [Anaerolineae bacterium]|nr:FHA domain-containing protein [Anaerolineae bacterium]
MIICPNCQHANHEGVLICSKCHTPLDEAIRRQSQTLHFEGQGSGQNEPRFGTARFQPHTQLLLRHHSSIHIIQVDVYQFREVILGRTDPDTGQAPDVDLEVFDAVQWGVSRRHARLDVQDDSLRITDLESANST